MKTAAWTLLGFFLVILLSAAIKWVHDGERITQARTLGWHQLPRTPSNLVPDGSTVKDIAIVKVLAAPAYGWRGYFAVHPWIVYKAAGSDQYTRYEVIGWRRHDVVRRNHAAPDGLWYGAKPQILVSHTGPTAALLIPQIEAAIGTYPYAQHYRSFPGPNSNTFLAHIGRQVPALELDLPPTAIGKDYREWFTPIGTPPSGQGLQVSLGGLLGGILSLEEGVELSILGLAVGIDINCPAFRLPFIGRLAMNGTVTEKTCLFY